MSRQQKVHNPAAFRRIEVLTDVLQAISSNLKLDEIEHTRVKGFLLFSLNTLPEVIDVIGLFPMLYPNHENTNIPVHVSEHPVYKFIIRRFVMGS